VRLITRSTERNNHMHDIVCYIDCTNTTISRHNTGIQRVVRNIIDRVPNYTKLSNITFIPVIAIGTKFYRLKQSPSGNLKWTKIVIDTLGLFRNILNVIFRKKRGTRNCSVDVLIADAPLNDLHFKIVAQCRRVMPYICKMAYMADNIIDDGKPVVFGEKDILFLADTFWKKEIIFAMTALDGTPITKIMLVYDIIAATYDNVFKPVYAENFTQCLSYLAEKLDGIITISRSALKDIKSYNGKIAPDLLYDFFYLGADFAVSAKISGKIRNNISELFVDSPVYLMVGTIEPRKNHSYVLDAFEVLWRTGSPVRLCIIGREGWMCNEVLKKMKESPYWGSSLYYFSDLNDDELEYCYERGKALVIASKVEGFGLPLVEAMHYGKPVFASDIPVFREIGEDYPIYFDLAASKSLADKILDFENKILVRQFIPRKWLSWDESIDDLLSKVVSMAKKVA
jgi:glycosyltransferase involved in cell wall biosynthesis